MFAKVLRLIQAAHYEGKLASITESQLLEYYLAASLLEVGDPAADVGIQVSESRLSQLRTICEFVANGLLRLNASVVFDTVRNDSYRAPPLSCILNSPSLRVNLCCQFQRSQSLRSSRARRCESQVTCD